MIVMVLKPGYFPEIMVYGESNYIYHEVVDEVYINSEKLDDEVVTAIVECKTFKIIEEGKKRIALIELG